MIDRLAAGLLPPLAQRSNWNALGTRFSGEHLQWTVGDVLSLLLVVAGFAALFWVLSRLAKLTEARPTEHSPRRLFAELAADHRLDGAERRACRRAAKEASLDEPAELFVRPSLREAVARHDGDLAVRLFGARPEATRKP